MTEVSLLSFSLDLHVLSTPLAFILSQDQTDDQIDAFFMCSGYPNANVTELSLMGKIDVISIDDEHVWMLLEKYPFYAGYATPDDQYKLGHPVSSVAVMSMLGRLRWTV